MSRDQPEDEFDLGAYIGALLPRYKERQVVPYRRVGTADGWVPAPKWCHDNADRYVSATPGTKRIRGWIFADLRQVRPMLGLDPYVELSAHSVVEDADGELFDITLTNLSNPLRHPFLKHEGSPDAFDGLVRKYLLGSVKLIPNPEVPEGFIRMESVALTPDFNAR